MEIDWSGAMTFLQLAWRFLVISAFGLWLGGFTLYTAFVIPIGHRHIPGRHFGFVTGEATQVLAVLSAVAIVLASVNLALEWKRRPAGGRWTSLATLLVLVATLAASTLLHAKLDAVLDYGAHRISDQERFGTLHERYELAATLQWAAGLVQVAVLLAGWRRADGERREASAG